MLSVFLMFSCIISNEIISSIVDVFAFIFLLPVLFMVYNIFISLHPNSTTWTCCQHVANKLYNSVRVVEFGSYTTLEFHMYYYLRLCVLLQVLLLSRRYLWVIKYSCWQFCLIQLHVCHSGGNVAEPKCHSGTLHFHIIGFNSIFLCATSSFSC